MSGVISRVAIVIAPFRGLITPLINTRGVLTLRRPRSREPLLLQLPHARQRPAPFWGFGLRGWGLGFRV